MRHFTKIYHNVCPINLFAKHNGYLALMVLESIAFQHISEHDRPTFSVWDIDSHRTATGNWSLDKHTARCHRKSNIVFQVCDSSNTYTGSRLHNVPRNRRPDRNINDLCRNTEFFKRSFQQCGFCIGVNLYLPLFTRCNCRTFCEH